MLVADGDRQKVTTGARYKFRRLDPGRIVIPRQRLLHTPPRFVPYVLLNSASTGIPSG